jgi:hypothetical protein
MRTIEISEPIRPDEASVPIDIDMQIPEGDYISTAQKSIYDLSDGTKANLISTLIDAAGAGDGLVRIALKGSAMTVGHQYHVQAEAETLLGQTYIEVRIVTCGKTSTQESALPYGARKSYFIDLSGKLPSSVSIVAASCSATVYDQTDLTADVSASLVASYAADGRTLEVRLENGVSWKTYIVNVIAVSTLDAVTNARYSVGSTIVVPCREL